MSHEAKIFDYQENGLSYTVTVYEKDGQFFADVQVNEGAMDVNAVYFGDDDLSGTSASLKGPLNMNGAGSVYEGEAVQWDEAIKLSDPGLGPDGTDKDTYLTQGDTLTIPLQISSLDDIDLFGIRATSTTTDAGSIKGVSGDPYTPEEPDEATYEKVFFDYGEDASGMPNGGYFVLATEPENNEFDIPALPAGTEPTFANYLNYFEEIGGDVGLVDSVAFYEEDEEGALQETFRIEAPEGGFEDAAAVIDAYDAAIAEMNGEAVGNDAPEPELMVDSSEETRDELPPVDADALELMASLTTSIIPENEPVVEDAEETEIPEMI